MSKISHSKLKILLLSLVVLLLSGCIILPIPTPEHGGAGVLPENEEELSKILTPGQISRADIILQWGAPSETFKDEKFIAYHWKRVRGYILIGVYMGPSGVVPWDADHFICLEFDSEKRLKAYKLFERKQFNPWDEPHKIMTDWIDSAN